MGELVSGTNIIHILENFKVNTDAQATNQGFYYQYLITLDDWLGYYLDKSNIAVYCETEDDIKAENSRESHIAFTQVKAYAKDFTLKSVEVRKSIVNFFQLFVEYKEVSMSTSFIFHTNTDFEGDFFNTSNGVIKISSIEKEKCIKEIEKLLISEFEKKNKKKLEQLDKDTQTYIDEIGKLTSQKAIESRKNKITLLDNEKNEINSKFADLKQYIQIQAPTFTDTIEWKAERKDKESSISNFIESIEQKIAKIEGFKLDIDSAYAHLINKVLFASQALNIEDRRLDSDMIDGLVKEAEDNDAFKKGLQSFELLATFNKVSQSQEKIYNKVDDNNKILERLDNPFKSDFEEAIKSIREDIDDDIENEKDKKCLYQTLNKTEEYFQDKLNFLKKILKKVDCLVEKQRHDTTISLYKFLSFIVLSSLFSKSFKLPSNKSIETIVDLYKPWLLNTFKKHKKIDNHIGAIANFFHKSSKIDTKVCFISSLKDNGGLNCDTCKEGKLEDIFPINEKINKVLTDFTNQSSFSLLSGNDDFMDLKKEIKIEFKCGECISNISEYKNAHKIMTKS